MIAPVIDIATARKPALSPADLLTRLRIEGLRVYLKEGTLFVGPQSAVTAEHRKLIRDHRDALIFEIERVGYLAAIAEKEYELNLLLEQNKFLSKENEASEDKRKRAESLLELTRIQLGIERAYASIRRSQPDMQPMPEDVRRFVISRCHPDHNQDSAISNKTMVWMNAQPREERQ